MRSRWRVALVALLAVLVVLSCAAGVVFDRLLVHAGRPDLVGLQGENWIIVAGIVSAAVVGASVALARPHNPVGWLFLALSVLMMTSGPLDGWADYGLVAKPGSLAGADLVAFIEDRTFIGWLVLVALVLYLTPTGRPLTPRWGLAAKATAGSGVVAFLLGLGTARPLPAPYQDAVNPLEVSAVQPAADTIAVWLVLVVGIGLIGGGVSLLVRFRRSEGDDRRQLLWMAFVVVPLPLFVVAAFVAANLDNNAVTVIATGGFVALVPVAAGLSVVRYHLYDVERLLATTVTYVVLSAVLVLTYGFIVWLGARGFQAWEISPAVSATIGAIVAVGLAAPLRRGLQAEIDRRFNRRQFDACQVIRDGLADEEAGVDLDELFRRAFTDDRLTVAYPGPEPDGWVTSSGLSPDHTPATVDVERRGRVIARIGFDPAHTDPGTIAAGAALASTELDNGRLLAEQARQLAEIGASRRRLAGAQRRERRRIERDLHDGAQQTLLALAFELQSAQLSGDEARMRRALSDGAEAARGAVRELRALANGLHPAALVDGGLPAALDDLARHSTVPLLVEAEVPRLDAALEFTAWLVIGEAVVNAQKHANATCIRVGTALVAGTLRLCVADDGQGGANPDGPGLRGLRDRVETARGTLRIRSAPGAGTTIEAVLPCGS